MPQYLCQTVVRGFSLSRIYFKSNAGTGFGPVDVVLVRREGDLNDRVPVVLGRDYEVGFEEVGVAFPG